MTSSLGFYIKPKVLHSPSFEDDDDDLFDNEEEDQDFENAEYLQEVPYTSSSSIDRSSIGSIPWADDAIKLNQLEWEKVDKMLSGLEVLPAEEDLRNEISDWQKKFPQLLGKKATYKLKAQSSDTLDLESLPSLNISSDEGDLDMDDKVTLTRNKLQRRPSVEDISVTPSMRKSSEESTGLVDLLQNFTLTSVPLKLSQRDTTKKPLNKRKCASSSSSYSLRSSPPTPVDVPIAQPTIQRLRMPPILNVIESTKKFRTLGRHNINPSFVQLTQVQQAKSAVFLQDQKSRSRFHTGHRSAWHVPLAANRFFNNRNSIILPAISSRQQVQYQYNAHPTTNLTSSEMGTNTTSSGTAGHLLRTNINNFARNQMSKRDMLNAFSTTPSTQTNTSNSGRSISAAVQYPRATFNALYLPYSASKFNAFK